MAPPPGFNKLTAATLLFGPMINWALYGVLCVQTYVYSYNFPDDRRLLKTLVYFVFLLETIQTALTGVDAYFWLIVGYGDFDGFKEIRFSPIDVLAVDAIISLIVQVFFCYRIRKLNERLRCCCIILVILSLIQAIGALSSGLKSAILEEYAISEPGVYVWLITSAIVDILIAVTMTFLLKRMGGNENLRSHYVLARIVRLTIETNTLTTAVAIVSFALYVGFPNNIFYLFPTAVIGKLYSNTLLVTFNNRIYFRDRDRDHLSLKGSSADIQFNPATHPPHYVPQVRPPQRIAIPNCTTGIPLDSFSSLAPTNADLERATNNDDHPTSGRHPGHGL